MKKIFKFVTALLTIVAITSPADAQVVQEQISTASQFNSEPSAKTSNSAAAIAGRTIAGASIPIPIASGGTGVETAGGADIRLYGAIADGRTDAGAAINLCFASQSTCVVAISQNGFFIKTPVVIPEGSWLIGIASSGANNSPRFLFPGTSWIKCAASISDACVTWGRANGLGSGGVKNVTISRVSGTPSPGQKGLVFAGGYNVRMENVATANFDTCFEFDQGISGQGINNYAQSCATHYWVFNTWPEFSQVGGRTGANGSGNPGTALDQIYFTSSLGARSRGAGPNSIDFTNYKFENDATACWLNWGNFTVPPGADDNFNFVNVYKETMPSGSSLFCSDSTVPAVSGVRVTNSYISQDTGPATMFRGMNAATSLNQWTFTNNSIFVSSSTLAPTRTRSPGINHVTFTGNFLPSLTFTPGGSIRGDYLVMAGNWMNTLVINQGANGWQGLSISGDQPVSYVNNSDGFNQNINIASKGSSVGLRAVANLPACTTSTKGFTLTVTNAVAAANGAAVTGGGSNVIPVFCNGSTWNAVSTAASSSFSSAITAPGLTLTDPANGNDTLSINNPSNTNGAVIKLTGGGENPTKFLRASGGNFQVLNNAFTASTLNIDDSGNTTVSGNISHALQEVDKSYAVSTPLTGATVTMTTGNETAIIVPAGTLASLIIILPACTGAYDGSIARYSSSQTITTLTVSSTSSMVSNAPSELSPGIGNAYLCRGSSTTWYRLY